MFYVSATLRSIFYSLLTYFASFYFVVPVLCCVMCVFAVDSFIISRGHNTFHIIVPRCSSYMEEGRGLWSVSALSYVNCTRTMLLFEPFICYIGLY